MTLGVAVYTLSSLVVICCLAYVAYRMYKSRASIARCLSRVRHKKPAARSITIRVGTESTPRLVHGPGFCPYRGSYSSGCSSSSDSGGSSCESGIFGGRLYSFSGQSTLGYEDRVYENRVSVSMTMTNTGVLPIGGECDDGETKSNSERTEATSYRLRNVLSRDRVVLALGNDFKTARQDLNDLMCRLESESAEEPEEAGTSSVSHAVA